MTDRVVDRLEAVEIHHQQTEVLAVALRTTHLSLQRLVEMPVVVQTCEPVTDRLPLHLLVAACVVDRDGRQIREEQNRLQLMLLELPVTLAIERDDTDHLAARIQRHDDRSVLFVLGVRDDHRARIVLHLVDELSFVVANDPPAHAFVHRAAPVRHLIGGRAAHVAAVQLIRLLVNEPDFQDVVVHDLLHRSRDLGEQVRLVERGQQGGAQVEKLVPQQKLRFELGPGLLELLVLTRVLDAHGGVGGEHLEGPDQFEVRESAVGRVVEVQNAHELALLVVERHEEIVVGLPLVRTSRTDVERGQVVQLLLRPVVLSLVHEEG